jgi:4-amino-4-deoxy-L-arabinose transferase-like glycosyltransferase
MMGVAVSCGPDSMLTAKACNCDQHLTRSTAAKYNSRKIKLYEITITMAEGAEVKRHWIVSAILLVLIASAAALLRLPWLGTEYYASGDEMLWGLAARNVMVHPLMILNSTTIRQPPEGEIGLGTRYMLFVRSTAYPILMAIPIALLGPNNFSLRLVNCLFGIGLVFLVYKLGGFTLGRAQGFAAAAILATLPAAIMFSRLAYNESMVAFLGLLAIGIVFRKKTVGGGRQAFFVGLLVGYAYLVKAIEILVFAGPAMLVMLLIQRDAKFRRWAAISTGTAVGVVLLPLALKALLTPWTVGNYINQLGFDFGVSWTKPFDFYFIYLLGEFSLLLPYLACGIFGVVNRCLQPGADRRMLIWILIAVLVVPISLPTVKKDTYSLILMPALALLAAEGMDFAARLRDQGAAWAVAGGAALIGLPVVALLLGWTPSPSHGSYLLMGRDFVAAEWPIALWIVLALNVLLVASALAGGLARRLPAGVVTAVIITAVAGTSGTTTWLGIVQAQEDLSTIPNLINGNWQAPALIELRRDILRIRPDRDLLVGSKVHSMDIAFHSVPARGIDYVRFDSDADMKALIDKAGRRFFYPFFADTMVISFRQYCMNPKSVEKLSPYAVEWYEIVSNKYMDVTNWFRRHYGVASSVRVYCLKNLNPAEVFGK